jgi:putative SOS response-associated peptidase YedK
MIITDANDFVGEVHDRMPVVLEPDQFEPWLSGVAGLEVLKSAPNDVLQKWPVSRRLNSSRASDDDATLIDPVPTVPSAGCHFAKYRLLHKKSGGCTKSRG